MNGRGGIATFFLFLIVIITLQVLSMIQSDRLYGRLNHLLELQRNRGVSETSTVEK